MHFLRASLALATSLLIVACAPDAWRSDSPYDAFLNQVQNKCWNLNIGNREVNDLLNGGGDASTSAYFLDLTSRFFNGQISRDNYVDALTGSYDAKPDSPGIRCILDQMPTDPQRLAPLIKY